MSTEDRERRAARDPDELDALITPESAAVRADTELDRVAGWRRVFRGNRTLWIVAAVAVVSLVGGLVVGRFVVSPADAAAGAQPPDPGLITVPVEFGRLSNDVTVRGDVGYADAVEVTIDAADVGGPAVVTGQVPQVGALLNPLSVALEIVGRPVIVLPGELPAYRTLRVGVSGPDVVQFKQALRAVGIDGGDPADPAFTPQTADAITALYAAVGYPPPSVGQDATTAVTAAQDSLRAADDGVRSAQDALGRAQAGPSRVEVITADNAVAAARRALATAQAEQPPDPDEIADLSDDLNLAIAQRQALDAAPDTSSQHAALEAARAQRADAQAALARTQQTALPALAPSEVLFLTELPRRVDDVAVRRGSILSGTAMTVSGADLQITASASESDAQLLAVGDAATFEAPDGTELAATVLRIEPPAAGAEGGSSRWSVVLSPTSVTPELTTQLRDQNVRVSIPVGATAGDVLAVPFAALTAGPGGESRVEVVVGDPRDGRDAETRLVSVTTGLAAGGLVEVTPTDGELSEGDLVVVGE